MIELPACGECWGHTSLKQRPETDVRDSFEIPSGTCLPPGKVRRAADEARSGLRYVPFPFCLNRLWKVLRDLGQLVPGAGA